jgi:hypothetical protein
MQKAGIAPGFLGIFMQCYGAPQKSVFFVAIPASQTPQQLTHLRQINYQLLH